MNTAIHFVNEYNDYFDEDMADEILERIGGVDVVILRHVMEHLDQLDSVVAGIKRISGDGLLLIEVPYLCRIIEEKQFYAFFHEHLSYFSVGTLNLLLNKAGIYIHHVYENELEGGSILICATSDDRDEGDNVTEYLEREKEILSDMRMNRFSREIESEIRAVKRKITEMADNNKTIAAWGAGQRGCTLINLCGLQSDRLKYVVDINENYWWKYVPGTDIQIVPPDHYRREMVDAILIFATGYADSIISENSDYIANGGEFIKIIEDER